MRITDKENKPLWGPWATLVWGVLVVMAFMFTQLIIMLLYRELLLPGKVANEIMLNGDAISFAEIIAACFAISLVFTIILFRRGYSIQAYLRLYSVSKRLILNYLGIMLLVFALMFLASEITNHPTPQVMIDIYASAKYPAVLWFALIIAAPLFEEILFRGFMFEGLQASAFGVGFAAVITSAIWAVIHMQYGAYEMLVIFLFGLLLCYAKVKSGSLYVPIMMHITMNLVATIEIALNLN